MEQQNTKEIVSKMLHEGLSPSQIQQKLASEYNIKLTFLELRLIIAEIDNATETLEKNAEQSSQNAKNDFPEEKQNIDGEADETITPELMDESNTEVELDKIYKPGAVLSGKVKFASGAKADWSIDQFGRFMLENAIGKPTQEDIMLFQEELQKKIGGA